MTTQQEPASSKKKFPQRLAEFNPSVDWKTRQKNPVRGLLNLLERVTLALEAPFSKLIRDSRFNPLYHTGTITVFLLVVILFTGIYLTMFYQFGFTASYEAIARLEANAFNRWMRAVHRFASGAALITGLLHGWRTFFQDRFRGARWLAWVTGVGMTLFFWVIGVTGYWLLWDERAQVINQTLVRLIGDSKWGSAFLLNFVMSDRAGSGWIFILLILTAHLLLSALVGLFLWWHLKRRSRPKWLPPRMWIFGGAALLLIVSAFTPIGLLPSVNPGQLPGQIQIDPLFLFYLPGALNWSPGLFWGLFTAIFALTAILPWVLARKPLEAAQVDLALCDGCILCSRDCPYNAITMVARTDGAHHKFQAEIHPDLCVACGICLGSCPENALSLGELKIDSLWQTTTGRVRQPAEGLPTKVVFTCERHLQAGAKSVLQGKTLATDFDIQIVPLTCVGMLNPNLVIRTLESGADSVQVVGCPPEDCANREGNLWLQQRLDRERLPRLKQAYANAPIQTTWAAPNQFAAAVSGRLQNSLATAYDALLTKMAMRSFIPALVILAAALALQVATNNINYQPFSDDRAMIEISMAHHSGFPLEEIPASAEIAVLGIDEPTHLVLEVNDIVVLDKEYPMRGSDLERAAMIFEQVEVDAGAQSIRLTMYDNPDRTDGVLIFDKSITLSGRQTFAMNFHDASLGSNPAMGRKLYFETSLGTNAGCRICHSLDEGVRLVGPSFYGVATRAAVRIPGVSAEDYLRQSILDPNAYVVEEYPAGQMVPNLGEILTEQQVDDLIAFLMTLE